MQYLPSSFVLCLALSTIVLSVKAEKKEYCQPNSPCWPSQSKWQSLNNSISGNLLQVQPWQQPCFDSTTFNQIECNSISQNYANASYRSTFVGSTQSDNWETCNLSGTRDSCSLDITNISNISVEPQKVVGRTCGLGRLSPYAVSIHNESDIITSLEFAQKYNIKVVIKNTGHEYLGRSTAPDSLMIWTHPLQKLEYHGNYKGKGPAMVVGAGVMASDAYQLAGRNNHTITLGAYSSVGE